MVIVKADIEPGLMLSDRGAEIYRVSDVAGVEEGTERGGENGGTGKREECLDGEDCLFELHSGSGGDANGSDWRDGLLVVKCLKQWHECDA